MMAKLKPCPSCRNKPEMQHGYEIETRMPKIRFACIQCGTYAQSAYSTSGAVEAWNMGLKMANKRLIDADYIYDAVERRYQVSSGIEHRCERDLLDLICSAPTVDAVEVVHGRWEERYTPNGEYVAWNGFYCSVCGKKAAKSNYCPNCGAKMDGGNEDG